MKPALPFTTFAVELARECGVHLKRYISDASIGKDIRLKGATDVVTRADHEVEALVASRIGAAFPAHGLLAEEGTVLNGDEYRWVVDPLDGTVNFAHGVPWFAVSIALEQRGETIVGVVAHPALEETFVAERGGGAWLSTGGGPFSRLRTSSAATLQNSLLATGFAGGDLNPQEAGAIYHLRKESRGVRNLGSAAIHLGYVAAGRLEAYWEPRLNLWDFAAGILLVEEAGGRVTDMDGTLLHSGDILASNGAIHDAILKVMADVEMGTQDTGSPRSARGTR